MDHSPYQAPQSQPSPQLDPSQYIPPGAIKTFGILHLIFAFLGLICNVGGSMMMIFMTKFMGSVSAGLPPAEKAEFEKAFHGFESYMNEISWVMWFYTICAIVLIIMLFIAGMGLLKNRDSGRRMSVIYACTSVITKVIYLILTIIFILPAEKKWYQAMPEIKSNPGAMDMSSTMSGGMQIITVLLYCIYPILVLVLLNSQKVKDYLRGR